MRPAVIIFTAAAFLFPALLSAFDSGYPEEPERFDSEYYLDILTMREGRHWRALADGTDNILSLDFGSLNVEQWVLLQSVKFSTPLSDNFRFRYWLQERNTLGPDSAERNEVELEWNFSGNLYLSFYLQPAFWKRENDIGLGIQSRDAVDSYRKLIFRVRDFANNFAYRNGDNIEGEENIYTSQPLELVLEVLDQAGDSFRYGIRAVMATRWEKEFRFDSNPGSGYAERGYMRSVRSWIEKGLHDRVVFSLDAGYAEFFSGRDQVEEDHIVSELFPRLWWFPGGADPEGMITRKGAASCSAGLMLRRERWERTGGEAGKFDKDELLPYISVRYAVSASHLLGAGYLGDRYESERRGAGSGSDLRWENRLELIWEIRLGKRARFRIIETIDLDPEDRGQFSVHDHFFLMSRVLF